MNKNNLAHAVANHTGLTNHEAAEAVDAVFNIITNAIRNGDRVTVVGFGTFEKTNRNPRTARNPRTGEPIDVPARAVPTFKAAAAFKTATNN